MVCKTRIHLIIIRPITTFFLDFIGTIVYINYRGGGGGGGEYFQNIYIKYKGGKIKAQTT